MAFLSLTWIAAAQEYQSPELTQIGKELPRSPFVVYPTVNDADAGLRGESKYLSPLTEWEKRVTDAGTEFSTQFTVPFAWVNRQVLLHIGRASSDYEIRLNGAIAGYSQNGVASADYNITKGAKEGVNTLTVTILSNPVSAPLESYTKASGASIDDCYILSQPTIRIREVLTRTYDIDGKYNSEVGIVVKSDALNPKRAKIHYELTTPAGDIVTYGSQEIELAMRREDTLRFLTPIPDTMLWSARNPMLYTLKLKTQTEGRYTEYASFKVGFRTVSAPEGRLTINGEPIELNPAPMTSTAPTPTQLDEWAAQGYNLLRLPAAGAARELYDLCDQLGFYVIEQAPINTSSSGPSICKGGNPSNDPQWQAAYIARIGESYHTSKFHPCIVAFSLAEKSANGINLYEGYLYLKSIEHNRPVIYPDAGGEWNTDNLALSAQVASSTHPVRPASDAAAVLVDQSTPPTSPTPSTQK